MRQVIKDCSVSAVVAGLIATLISYVGPLLIIFQVAAAANLPAELLSSWIWAISIGSGVLGIALSYYYKVPVIIAWSAPGSALLLTLLPGLSYAEAVGAYLMTALLLLLLGLTGAFDRLLRMLPPAITAAMLCGILLQFGMAVFGVLPQNPLLVLLMLLVYIMGRRFLPRYAIVLVLVTGLTTAMWQGQVETNLISWQLATVVWTTPLFSLQALLNVSVPLLLVALTGQFMPGMAVLRQADYPLAASPLLTHSALGSALLAPFGCHGLNLAAITAAICTGKDAHPDPARRYIAGISGGLFYLLMGVFGGTLVALFSAFPKPFIAALAGLALFGAIAGSLHSAMAEPKTREAALIALLLTSSGISLFGLAAAFWGLTAGLLTHFLLTYKQNI